jgi:CYTH domain-containing protein
MALGAGRIVEADFDLESNSAKERAVRIRTADAQAFITIKGMTVGATRSEYEYEIPFGDAKEMLETCRETADRENAIQDSCR